MVEEFQNYSNSVYNWLSNNRQRWCSMPKVGPSDGSDMSQCEQCAIRFSLLRRRRTCDGCEMIFCSSCAKRVSGGARQCHKCLILSQWPVDYAQVAALRIRDLRSFLHKRHVNTSTCTEKGELIHLVIVQLRKQHASSAGSSQTNWRNTRSSAPYNRTPPVHSNVTKDDGIRVRPSNIAVPDADASIRVFASNEALPDKDNDNSTSNLEGAVGGAGLYPRIPNLCQSVPDVTSSNISEFQRPASPDAVSMFEEFSTDEINEALGTSAQVSNSSQFQPSTPSEPVLEEVIEQVEDPVKTESDNPKVSPSNTVQADSVVQLDMLTSDEDIKNLSVRQCKEILTLHRINYKGVKEKHELIEKVKILCKDYKTSKQDIEQVPEELVCKICMDHVIDCVLLECGHTVTCLQCGKQMSECPVCRQYVVRVVRTFRA